MNKIHTFVFLLVLSIYSSPLYAATYHVAVNAPGASDSNDGQSFEFNGSSAGPWRTLNYAASVAQAGDRVLIYDGDYRQENSAYGQGTIAVLNSGTSAAASIEFSAAPKMDTDPTTRKMVRVYNSRVIRTLTTRLPTIFF